MSTPSVRYEKPESGIARIVLNRPQQRNAQNTQLLYELDAAFMEAAQDTEVKVIILSAEGPDFSSGHDVREEHPMPPGPPVASLEGGFAADGVEGRHAFECEVYLGMCRRWRDLPKPTIAQVQGRCIAGGLMLIWPMDLIVAGESALFSDPVVAFGLNGGEYFAHGWEVGPRRAKEMLFTGEPMTATDAYRLGMVNRVVPDEQLAGVALSLARKIRAMPAYGLRLAKASVNAGVKAQGLDSALDSAFGLHLTGHANNFHRHDGLIDPEGLQVIRALASSRPTGEDSR
ncbi:enoyl-CoA hydratase [Aeromicrobium sp. PE09-221]|uniref:enoyl-CoA hydratase n=1 Tax=Aeromicrobium sp. PE09-221 TaxID=1898043 RepID=UPI000B3E516F|nr:enoyl-CoA hydratase [Aeromicrobium sp. PE09-221]OUZ09425.1 enoyl-CoA hydratase [Aeromicrobium sp. PE09-221]